MDVQYRKEYSHALGRDMEYKIYGWGGSPVLYFPCQNGRFFDFENFGMADCCQSLIDGGRIQVFSVDTVDAESLSADWKPGWERIERQEQYYRYIADELAPRIKEMNAVAWEKGILTMGFSLGAYHSANFYFRRPDIFTRTLSCSGIYQIRLMIQGFSNELTYLNSPADCLANLPWDHYYMDLFRQNRGIIVVGQGAWEHPMQESTRELDRVLCEKGIPVDFQYWGYDVSHDWYWWKRQTEALLPGLIG